MTTPHPETPAEVLGRYAAAQPRLQKLHDMTVNYFRCKCLGTTDLERRPPVALCLRDPDHVFTLKPGYRRPRKRLVGGVQTIEEYGQMEFDTVYIDCVSVNEMPPQNGRPVPQHQQACKLRLTEAGELSWSGNWYPRFAPIAVHEFVKTADDFVLFPWQIFSRSKDRCCCCGRRLTDDQSRSRGIGPECLRSVALCFGEPVK